MRIKVRLDLTQPLQRGIKLRVSDSKEVRFDFKYKKLPNFCYNCGVIGHTLRE